MNLALDREDHAPLKPSAGVWILASAALAMMVRIACFPYSSYAGSWEYCDAPTRVAMAIRWLHHPGVMTTKDCEQFGPLHIYLIAGALSLWKDIYLAPRFLSLVLGVGTALPLFFLTRILFNQRAALYATLFFAFHTLQVKSCGVAMAEAAFGFFFLMCVYFFVRFRGNGRPVDRCLAALMLSISCMIRYDAWPYIPLMALLTIRTDQSGAKRFPSMVSCLRPVIGFGLIAGLFPVLWLITNYVKGADPLFAWKVIAAGLESFPEDTITRHGVIVASVFHTVFVPAILFLSLTPAVAVLAGIGFVRALRRRHALAYAALFLPFIIYYVQSFGVRALPIARYWMLPGLLMLPYAGAQMDLWTRALSATGVRRKTAAVVLSAALVFSALLCAAYSMDLPFHQRFWSISPVSPMLPEEKQSFDLIKSQMQPGDRLVPDGSVFSRCVTFNLDPTFGEHWWDVPNYRQLSQDEFARHLRSSAPGFLLVYKLEFPFMDLLSKMEQTESNEAGIRVQTVYSKGRYGVYHLPSSKAEDSQIPR